MLKKTKTDTTIDCCICVQAVLALKAREEEIRKVSQEASKGRRLLNEEERALGKVAVNAPYAIIVTPGRELADQVGTLRLVL